MDQLINCRICGASNKVYYEIPCDMLKDRSGLGGGRYIQRIYECSSCGYVGIIDSPFTDNTYRQNYENSQKYSGVLGEKEKILDNEQINFQERHEYVVNASFQHAVASLISNDVKSVCDVGASTGYLLSCFENCKERLGIDPNPINKRIAKNYYNVEMYTGLLNDFDREYPDRTFDLVVASQVIEHVENVTEFVEIIKKHAKKYILIDVPTIDVRYEGAPYELFTEEHISYFSFNTVKHLFEEGGRFRLIHAAINLLPQIHNPMGFPSTLTIWKEEGYEGSILQGSSNAVSALQDTKGFLANYMQKSQIEFEGYKRKLSEIIEGKKVALFCAGTHTARAYGMGLFENSQVVVIYDNDKSKHGKYLYDIEVKSFELTDIDDLGIEYIIISTVCYQKEICDYLIENGVTMNQIILLWE